MRSFGLAALVCGLLAALTLLVYWPVREHEFLNYDDPDYVTENSHILPGVTREGLRWAFCRIHGEHTYWHPVSWVSHMMDCELFGLDPQAHHLVNLGFHAVNVALLFLVLRQLTGAWGRSAVVAALFAVHPLQVDTVAWVSERKNLLSTLFLLLSVSAYVSYARQAEAQRRNATGAPRPIGSTALRLGGYGAAILSFVLGLMSKPTLVTLPFLLLLLDYWPLRRIDFATPMSRFSTVTRLVLKKSPFFALAGAVSVVTLVAHQRLGILSSPEQAPMGLRVANAIMSYARYLQKTVWPENLAVYYPYPTAWPWGQVMGAAALLAVLSALGLWRRRSQPALLVGWCWFLGTLVPTIGLVQAGAQALADRFMYVPLIGLALASVWGLADAFQKCPGRIALASAAAAFALSLAALVTRHQLQYWKDSVSLFEHALQVTGDNPTARNNLGTALAARNRFAEAAVHFRALLQLDPDSAVGHCNLGSVLDKLGRTTSALEHYRTALKLDPQNAAVHFNLANSLADRGQLAEAVSHYQEALRLQPDYPSAHNNLAVALNRLGNTAEALAHVRQALQQNPYHAEAWNNLGGLYAEKSDETNALDCYRRAVRLSPDLAQAHYNLGHNLLRLGRTNDAIASLRQAVALDANHLEARYQLADLYASMGDSDAATRHLAKIAPLGPDQFAAWSRLGAAMMKLGQFPAATNCFGRALQINPDSVEMRINLANALTRMGKLTAADAECRETLRRAPQDARAHHALGRILHHQGKTREATRHLLAAAESQPDWPEALNDAAWLLATAPDPMARDGQEAVRLALRANEITQQSRPNMVGTLAAAFAAAGRFSEAVATAERAVALAEQAGQQALADQTRARLKLYQAGQPYVDESTTAGTSSPP